MSPSDAVPRVAHIPKDAGRARAPRLLVFGLSLALAAAALTSAPSQTSLAQQRDPLPPQATIDAEPTSVTLCEGEPAVVKLTLKPAPNVRLRGGFKWDVGGGKVQGEGGSAVWYLSGVKPGRYTARVLSSAPRLAAAESAVVIASAPRRGRGLPAGQGRLPRGDVRRGDAHLLRARAGRRGEPPLQDPLVTLRRPRRAHG